MPESARVAFGQINGSHSRMMVCPEDTEAVCKPTDQDSVSYDAAPGLPSPRPHLAHEFLEMVRTQPSTGLGPTDKKLPRRESPKKRVSLKHKLLLEQVRVPSGTPSHIAVLDTVTSQQYPQRAAKLTTVPKQMSPVPSRSNKRQIDSATMQQPAKRSRGDDNVASSVTGPPGDREGSPAPPRSSNVASATTSSNCPQRQNVEQQGLYDAMSRGKNSPPTLEAVAHTKVPPPKGASLTPAQSASYPSAASKSHEGQSRGCHLRGDLPLPPPPPSGTVPGLGMSRSETIADNGKGTVQQAQQSTSAECIGRPSSVKSGQPPEAQEKTASYLDHRFILSNVPISPATCQGRPEDINTVTADETIGIPVACMDLDQPHIDPYHLLSDPTVADLQDGPARAPQPEQETLFTTSPIPEASNESLPTCKEIGGSPSAGSERCLQVPGELQVASMEMSLLVRRVQELSTQTKQEAQALLTERAQLRDMLVTVQEERDISLTSTEEWKLKAKDLEDTSLMFAKERERWLGERRALGTEKTRLEKAMEAQSSSIRALQEEADAAQANQAQDTATITELRCQLSTKAAEATSLTRQHEDLQSQYANVKGQNDRLTATAKDFKSIIKENSRLRGETDMAKRERARLKTAEQEMQAVTEENLHLKAEAERLQSRFKKQTHDLELSKKATQGLVDTILEKDRSWSAKREALETEKAKLSSDLQDQVKLVAVLQRQALDTEARQARDSDTIKELQTEKNGLKSRAQARQTEVQTVVQEKQVLSEARDRLQLELDDERKNVQTLRRSLGQEASTITDMRSKYKELRRTVKCMQDTVTAVSSKLADSENMQVRLRADHTKRIRELESAMEIETTRHASELDALGRERDDVSAAKQRLGVELEACQEKAMTLETTVGSLEASNHNLLQSVADRDAALEEKVRRNRCLERRNLRLLLRAAACRYRRRLIERQIQEVQDRHDYLQDWAHEAVSSGDNYERQLVLARQQLQDKERDFQFEIHARDDRLSQSMAHVEDLKRQLARAGQGTQQVALDLASTYVTIEGLLKDKNVLQISLGEERARVTAAGKGAASSER